MRYVRARFLALLFIGLIASVCIGCALPRKVVENISGNYMGGLNSEEAKTASQVCLYGLDECFDKVLAILQGDAIDATILKIDRRNYAILALVSTGSTVEETESLFDANSTDIGIYLTKIGPETTRVEVRSLSSVFTDYTAGKLFPELQKQN
jgi:hypothetical protein